jgi:hypothetical protein
LIYIYKTTLFGDTPYNGHAWKIKTQIVNTTQNESGRVPNELSIDMDFKRADHDILKGTIPATAWIHRKCQSRRLLHQDTGTYVIYETR